MSEHSTLATPAATPNRLTWGLLVVAGIYAAGSVLQLFLAGMGTFDSGAYWSDHIFLGRLISLFALLLPVVAWFARAGRSVLVLSVIAAVFYIVQTMLATLNLGPLSALHAVNALPLIILPAIVALRAWEVLRK